MLHGRVAASLPAQRWARGHPGQQWDEESGLAFNINRYYDKTSGRYIQADPIGLDGGWNRFGYVGGESAECGRSAGLESCAHQWRQLGCQQSPNAVLPLWARHYGIYCWASGVNGALVSPAVVNPLVAQIPMYASRMTPVAAGIVEAIETGAFACIDKSPQLFRGGNMLVARLGVDVRAAADGLIHPLGKNGKPQGISLNRDPLDSFIQKYGGAFPVNSLPEGLKSIQSGKPDHFVVSPAYPMSF